MGVAGGARSRRLSAAMRAIYLAAQVRLPYPMSPAGWAGAATLLILIIPAGIAACVGAGAVALV